jgi:biopolymer transport protein ExbD
MRLIDDEPDVPAQINIVPMIDVIFAILTYFIMSTLTLSNFEGMPLNLPSAANSQTVSQQVKPVYLSITPEGRLFIDKQETSLDRIAEQINQRKGQAATISVVLNADKVVPHGIVVGVMDQLRRVPGVKLAIATIPQ